MPDFRTLDLLESFIRKEIRPYRNAYVEKTTFGWKHMPYCLTNNRLRDAILGMSTLAYYQNFTRIKVIGIDLDDHSGKGWADPKSASLLWAFYHQLLEEKHLPTPSLLFHSPHGMHLYYLLEDVYPAAIIFPLLKDKLQGKGIEVRPTDTEPLRVPNIRRLVDPRNGRMLDEIGGVVSYALDDVLGLDITPHAIRSSLLERKENMRRFSAGALEAIERQWTPFVNGSSNEALVHLAPAYKAAGLSVDETIQRINNRLENSAAYSLQGELRNPRRLRKRIESFYKQKNHPSSQKLPKLSPEEESFISAISKQQPWARQRLRPVRIFLEQLLRWKNYQDSILKNPALRARNDYLFPFYIPNLKEGYYPLPTTLLKKWNRHYFSIVSWLVEKRILKRAPYPYVPGAGICSYYRIHTKMIHR